MAKTVISAKYPPLIDATRTPLAYGDRALRRLNRELNDETLLVRQRSVMSLCDYLHDPEHIAEALRVGIAVSLKKLLTDPDLTVRQKATECLYVFAGALGIVQTNLVPILVQKLLSELDEIKKLILDTLHFCMRVDTEKALKADAMTAFTELLSHKNSGIRAKAARDIMDLSVPLDGKNKAVECGSVPPLIELLKDPLSDVRANAAGAIMTITITTKGKYTAIDAGAIAPLVDLVQDATSEVRLNALKALTCLSEAPEGRKVLLEHVEEVRSRMADAIPAVCKAAEIAVRVITWKP
ncbi:hypothetical protein BaRGS_00032939 [Batillaria attramentaria]|uniref:U-box domain-containing protein n=1 Tax=Batillaria attramentaria TaxID=370345 RepID=A0ABD0JLA5_9CAEN